MDEEQQKEETQEGAEETNANPNNRVSTIPVLEEARQLQEEQRKVNAETARLNQEKAALLAEERLAGRAGMGLVQEPETPTSRAKEFWKGTPIEEALERHGDK